MVSSLTTEGTDLTMRALELGAYDFVAKPGGANAARFVSVQDELLEKVHSAKFARLGRSAPHPAEPRRDCVRKNFGAAP